MNIISWLFPCEYYISLITDISHLCPVHSPAPPQDKVTYEKVGESTEVALKVLAEKLNVQGLDRSSLTATQKATACLKCVEQQFKKVGGEGEGIVLIFFIVLVSPFHTARISHWSSLGIVSP